MAHTLAKNRLRTILASAEEQSLKFSTKVLNETAAIATQFAKCILLHAYSRTIAAPSCTRKNKNFIYRSGRKIFLVIN